MPYRFLVVRAVIAFLLLPGVVAFAVPLLWLRPPSRAFSAWGVPFLTLGALVLLACTREFYVAGRGTLAPWSPPRHLVISGLYRFTRNPMYVGVLLLLVGWAVAYGSRSLALYAAAILIAFHARIRLHEEPWLSRTFGQAWTAYAAATPRWLFGRRGGASDRGAG